VEGDHIEAEAARVQRETQAEKERSVKCERERVEKEQEERDRVERERVERERVEAARVEREKQKEKKERERLEKVEWKRLEKVERERLEKVERERLEKVERERLEKVEREPDYSGAWALLTNPKSSRDPPSTAALLDELGVDEAQDLQLKPPSLRRLAATLKEARGNRFLYIRPVYPLYIL